ncbi:hypothetical protein LXA43DRAFT_975013 [Ganoderma leucocontextum]|nr:hypothetical protein LXA43DRAFT_975013 [Ganoderma leucocontextum]
MVVTSPNMHYVPEYPVESTIIDTYSDGRWGIHEYSRWPQDLVRGMWHVACIPSEPLPPHVPDILWQTLLPETHWVEDRTIGFSGVGFINEDTQACLIAAAETAIRRCEEMNAPENVAKYGRFLVMILRQVIDRMRFNPVVAGIAVAVTAHVQRVCLELAGLKTYAEVVVPRLASEHDRSADILPVLGAFVREGSDAQNCVHVGLPTWVLQPLTHELPVWEVVECRTPSFAQTFARSLMPSEPRIFQEPKRIAGVPNLTGNWLSGMLEFVSRQVAGTHLTPMSVAEVPRGPQEEVQSSKRRRRQSKNGQGDTLHVHVDVSSASSTSDQRPCAVSLPPGAAPHHPSKSFTPSPFHDVTPVWATALRAVSPIARAMTSATYFFPPPFLLDTVSSAAISCVDCTYPERARRDDKVIRYIHNFVRIREFCRMRLFDVTIANEPLTIAEWRTALWGDYLVTYHPPSNGSGPSDYRRSVRCQEERKGVTRLFGNVAHFPSYREDEAVQLADMRVDLGMITSNPRVRLHLLWETHEVNFRAELLCLDTLMVQKPTWTYGHKLHREFVVSRVWGPPLSIMSIFPNNGPREHAFRWFSPPGQEWKQCCETLRSFAGCPQEVVQGLPPHVSEDIFARVQAQAVDFYVRVFVKTFARLPIPPIMPPM